MACIGNRTMLVRQHFTPSQEMSNEKLKLNGVSYSEVTSEMTDFSTQPIASLGINREIILLNPNDSPFLQKKYQEFVENNRDLLSMTSLKEEDVILKMIMFIRDNIFSKGEGEPLTAVIRNQAQSPGCPQLMLKKRQYSCIHLDAFIENQVGASRHHALTSAYFLHRLITEGKLMGKVAHVRALTDAARNGHTWTVYVNNKQNLRADSHWGIVSSTDTPVSCYEASALSIEEKVVTRLRSLLEGEEKARAESDIAAAAPPSEPCTDRKDGTVAAAAEASAQGAASGAVDPTTLSHPTAETSSPAPSHRSLKAIVLDDAVRAVLSCHATGLFDRFNTAMQKSLIEQPEYNDLAQRFLNEILESGDMDIASLRMNIYNRFFSNSNANLSSFMQTLSPAHTDLFHFFLQEFGSEA